MIRTYPTLSLLLLLIPLISSQIVINTWPWTDATDAAYKSLLNTGSPIDSVVSGCTQCEIDQCDHTVGYGGSPDESGETTLDAMVMDGNTMNVGAVGDLRRIRNAIGVARFVLEHTEHTLLAGDQATDFAKEMGFEEDDLTTRFSEELFVKWKNGECQPNYWIDVFPDNKKHCGPYKPVAMNEELERIDKVSIDNHDTIAMIAMDALGNMAAGTSTNGANHKIPGRIGDGPIMGAGAYVDSTVGGCGATGDGDVMMRFLPCFLAVEKMRDGMNPTDAAEYAMRRIHNRIGKFTGALITMNNKGILGAASVGWDFHYTFQNKTSKVPIIINVPTLYF